MFQGIELIILILRYYPEGIGQTLEISSIYLTELKSPKQPALEFGTLVRG